MASKCLFLMVLGLVALVGSTAVEFPGGGLAVSVTGGGDGDGDPTDSMPCVKKLIPCQPYLHAPEKVPVSCCLPLKQMVSDDTKCLCGLFNNVDVLKKLNLTQDEALKLPKACGANADISICKKDSTSPPKSPETPPTSNYSSPKKNAAHSHSQFEGLGFAAFFMALISSSSILDRLIN
ncbi:non-specific lipid transfer protein GPI-anchored 3-like [Argentina anserina]|uniref:non-specific lipid transfer protein GPI-anchored 3-like n=1 Tax=Argentina anserina TaxID=57926 RepID=UPI002176585D|nr:non-specific lipid transfer protein GPI-anchored 3-like [Potentilla anserina]